MWKITPATEKTLIGTIGLVKKAKRKYTSSISGDINTHEVQKNPPGTVHIHLGV